MTIFQITAIVVSIAALFSYINFRFIKLPTTIGVMLIALLSSAALLIAARFGVGLSVQAHARDMLEQVDFDATLMQGMLSFLLFAGALHVNLTELVEQRLVVTILATVGVVISTFVIGTLVFFVAGALHLSLSYSYCLLFGALISPTDPIAVVGILKSAGIPKSMEIRIAGESLFNDGVGVVVFIVLAEIAIGHHAVTVGHVATLFFTEAIGGALFGLAAGWVAFGVLRSVDNYQVEVLWTLGLVTGGYALASALHVSGPIAIVVAGLVIGNHGRRFAMSARTRDHLDKFWELIDSILNAILFVLVGLEMLALTFSWRLFVAGLAAIPIVLAARWLSVGLPAFAMQRRCAFQRGELTLFTWGGLRGGISVALALSIPAAAERETILAITYAVVVFAIAVQGLTIQRVVTRLFGSRAATADAAP